MPTPLTEEKAMKPLIFSTRSILAWQRGAKTQTRRLVKPQPPEGLSIVQIATGWLTVPEAPVSYRLRQPHAVGDLLWIREALVWVDDLVTYAADKKVVRDKAGIFCWPWKRNKLPAIFMPRWACRYYARVTSVRPERLQDISVEDAVAEGMPAYTRARGVLSVTPPDHRWWYIEWWNELHRKPEDQWEASPWVWVYELENADASATD